MDNFAERLKNARKMSGFSMQQLADKMNNVITKQAIGKYELGQMKPDNQVLLLLCTVLGVRPDYFMRENNIELENVEFRKMKKLPVKDIEAIKQKTIDFLERYFELEGLLGISTYFEQHLKTILIRSEEDIEQAAIILREKWKLGMDAIPNILKILEDQEIKVFEIEADESFVGMSTFVKNIPVIVLNKNLNNKLDRKRFTAIHELAHLILNIPEDISEKEKEKICHQFAGAFIIPKEVFIREFGKFRSAVYIKELIIMKEHFGLSIQGIMARAKFLGLITEQTYTSFNIHFSSLGYRKNEPGKYECSSETSHRFHQLIYRALAEEIISIGKAAALNNQKISDFRNTLDTID
jgi:Zn-dependent peptidase ImmA (M78 family)/DNA-binding XRE family transcriptional regulator